MRMKEWLSYMILEAKHYGNSEKRLRFACFRDKFSSSPESIFQRRPPSFILVPFYTPSWQWQTDSSMYSCLLANFMLLFASLSCNLHRLSAVTNNLLVFETLQNYPRRGRALRWASCSSVCVSQPLHVGGSHPDIPADVLNKGGALLMGTMHQLIVFFCGLVCHSSSALVVIFLLEFTLEERRLF